jgi:lipopolysaccharide/colanic/teichoic acid biosynthesis glycosyltransferase
MSMVGPRLTLPYQVERYNVEQQRRLGVQPGITGCSQIHGDEAIGWPERIELDNWYIDNWLLWLDIKTMFLTPFALLRIRKVNVEEGPPPGELQRLEIVKKRLRSQGSY